MSNVLAVFNPSMEIVEGIAMMSSREFCSLTGKRHDHIMRDIREEFTDFEGRDTPNLGDLEEGISVFLGFEKDVKIVQSSGERASHILLSKRASLILGAKYSKKVRRVLVDYFLSREDSVVAEARVRLLEEQKAFKEARKTNAETIMVKLLDIEKNIHYHKFVSVTKPVDYDAKLQGQYVRALMSARSALEKLKEKGYDVPTIYRKRILRSSDITGWGEVDTRTRTFIDEEDVEHEVEETMEEIDMAIPNFLNI